MLVGIGLNVAVYSTLATFGFGFTAGNALALILTMLTVSGIFIRIFIFERPVSDEEKIITVWWLCCLTFKSSQKKRRIRGSPRDLQLTNRFSAPINGRNSNISVPKSGIRSTLISLLDRRFAPFNDQPDYLMLTQWNDKKISYMTHMSSPREVQHLYSINIDNSPAMSLHKQSSYNLGISHLTGQPSILEVFE